MLNNVKQLNLIYSPYVKIFNKSSLKFSLKISDHQQS